MTTLEEFFSDQVPSELSDTLCDPISYTIMVYPVFCSGRTYDRITLEGNGWKDPFSAEQVDPSVLQVNIAVDSSIEKFLQRHTNLFLEKQIIEKINTEDKKLQGEAFENALKLISLLGDRKRRDVYLNASRELLNIFTKFYSTLSPFISSLEEKRNLFLSFLFERTGYPYDYISEFKVDEKPNSLLLRLLNDNHNLFSVVPPNQLVKLFQLEKLQPENTPFFHYIVLSIVKSLKINPIRYIDNLSFNDRYNIVQNISIGNSNLLNNLSDDEANLLLEFDNNLPDLPQNILALKLRAMQFPLLSDEVQKLRTNVQQKNQTIQQLKYSIYITSLLPTHNTVRFISRANVKRCLTITSNRVKCELVSNDSSAKYQEWAISSTLSVDGRQCYLITNPATNKALDNDYGSSEPGNPIIVYTRGTNNPAQQWQILPIVDSYVTIRNSAAGGSITFQDPDVVSLHPSNANNTLQHFSIEPF